MDRSIKIVNLEQVFKLYRFMFKELKEKKKQLPSHCFYKHKKENTRKVVKYCFGGGIQLFVDFYFLFGCTHPFSIYH